MSKLPVVLERNLAVYNEDHKMTTIFDLKILFIFIKLHTGGKRGVLLYVKIFVAAPSIFLIKKNEKQYKYLTVEELNCCVLIKIEYCN